MRFLQEPRWSGELSPAVCLSGALRDDDLEKCRCGLAVGHRELDLCGAELVFQVLTERRKRNACSPIACELDSKGTVRLC